MEPKNTEHMKSQVVDEVYEHDECMQTRSENDISNLAHHEEPISAHHEPISGTRSLDYSRPDEDQTVGTSPDSRVRKETYAEDDRARTGTHPEDDYIHSLSSIGSAGTLMDGGSYPSVHDQQQEEEEEEHDHQNTVRKLVKTRRSSVSTTNLPQVFSGSHRSIYTSIVLMPEQGAKWNQLAERDDKISKFCVIPVLEDQVGSKIPPTDKMEESPEAESAQSSLESNNPLRALLARRAIAMQHSELSPVTEMPFGSAVDINQSLRDISKAKKYGQTLPGKASIRKNFILECLSFFFVYSGYVPIRGMMTSLNHEKNLGGISVSVNFVSGIAGSLICPILVQRYGPKRTICVSLFAFLIYALGNLYASFYTLIPASLVFGLGFSILLGARGAYQANLAAAYSTATNTKIENVLPFFSAIYFTFLQSANIAGNGLASTILKVVGPLLDPAFYAEHEILTLDDNTTINATSTEACGADFSNTFTQPSKVHVAPAALYTLLGIMIFLILLSICICVFFVERLDCIFKRRNKSLVSHLKTVFSYHREFNTWPLLCMAMFSSFGPALVYGDLVKAFVTCPVGLDMIGYAIVCYATGSAVTSFSSGFISKLTGPAALQYVGFAMSASLYSTMLTWRPSGDQMYYIFLLFSFLGSNDAIYQTRYYSLVGTLFVGQSETAYSFFLMYQSVVGAAVFASSPLLSTRHKLHLAAGFMLLNLLAYTTLMLKLRRDRRAELKQVDV